MPKKIIVQNCLEKFHNIWMFPLGEASAIVESKHSALVLLNLYARAEFVKCVPSDLYAKVNLGTKAMNVSCTVVTYIV